jgi:Replication-relaxation
MATLVTLSDRDLAMLRLLEMTPATATQIRRACVTFPGEPFRDERRVRERLQALSGAGFTRTVSAGLAGGGLLHYYRLAVNGFRAIHPESNEPFPKYLATDIAPSRIQHATTTADVIVHTLVSSQLAQVKVSRFSGDGRLTLEAGEYRQQPDCHFQLEFAGMYFNLLFEIDNATEPLDSRREQSIRTKILGYETYQDWVLRVWKDNGRPGKRPSFRVIFLTKGAERANHILWLAHSLAHNKDRNLVYASTQDQYLGSATPLQHPTFSDHFGQWTSLLNPQPTSGFTPRPPIRLRPPVASSTVV